MRKQMTYAAGMARALKPKPEMIVHGIVNVLVALAVLTLIPAIVLTLIPAIVLVWIMELRPMPKPD